MKCGQEGKTICVSYKKDKNVLILYIKQTILSFL